MGAGSRARAALLLALLTLAALGARLAAIGYGLPQARDPDAQVVEQVRALAAGPIAQEQWYHLSAYPLLLARSALALGLGREPRVDAVEGALAAHLDAAGRPHRDLRLLVACASVLLVVATWWLARPFLEPPWALFAAALVATSMLALHFGRVARPHGFAAPWIVLAVAGWMRFAVRGDLAALALASLGTALAIAALPNGLATLPAAAAAWWLQPRRPRWLVDARLLVPLAALAAAVWVGYPFWFVEWPADPDASGGPGVVRFGWHQALDSSDLDGRGFRVLGLTFALYEPVALGLACAGAGAWLFWGRRAVLPAEIRRARLVALAFALPYVLVLGLYARTQQRFALPLVPFVALLGAYGARSLASALARNAAGRVAARALPLVALALPAGAVCVSTYERVRPHPLEQLADWIRAHVERDRQRVALHVFYDVPLARRREHFLPRPGLAPRFVGPWLAYQERVLSDGWRGERWDVVALYPDRAAWPVIAADPDAYVRSLDVDFVVVPCGGERLDGAPASEVREALRRAGSLVFALHSHADGEPRDEAARRSGLARARPFLGEDTTPQLEVWALARR